MTGSAEAKPCDYWPDGVHMYVGGYVQGEKFYAAPPFTSSHPTPTKTDPAAKQCACGSVVVATQPFRRPSPPASLVDLFTSISKTFAR